MHCFLYCVLGGWSLLFKCLILHLEYAKAKFSNANLNSWVWLVWNFFTDKKEKHTGEKTCTLKIVLHL